MLGNKAGIVLAISFMALVTAGAVSARELRPADSSATQVPAAEKQSVEYPHPSVLASSSAAVSRVGVLGLRTPSGPQTVPPPLRDGLRDLGYVEGQNVAFELRVADAPEQYPALVAELVKLPVDVIASGDTAALLAAKQATSTIPIVMLGAGDPAESGLVASLEQHGNITGVISVSPGTLSKQFALLKEAFPRTRNVAVLVQGGHPLAPSFPGRAYPVARELGLQLDIHEPRTLGDFDTAFARAVSNGADALYVARFPLTNNNRGRIIELADQLRLPAMYPTVEYAEDGGLMAYGVENRDLVQQAAGHVAKILQGASAAQLPIETPKTFAFVVNLKTVGALGVTIPESVLAQTTKVIPGEAQALGPSGLPRTGTGGLMH